MARLWGALVALGLMVAGCDDGEDGGGPAADAAVQDAARADTGGPDAAVADARPADAAPTDAGVVDAAVDGGVVHDGAPADAALLDATTADATQADADLSDAAPLDDAAADAARPDAAAPDLGPPECEGAAGCLDFRACVDGRCVDPGPSPAAGLLVLNEVLIDGAIDADANDDGDVSAVDDAFVELVNVGDEEIDLGGFVLVETDLQGIPRHTFPAGFTLEAGRALVVFGGGNPSDDLEATGALFVTVNAADPAFSNGLNLDAAGDTLRLLDAARDEVIVFSYGPGCDRPPCAEVPADRSLTRVPDLTGDLAPHPDAPISPGTQSDGAPF